MAGKKTTNPTGTIKFTSDYEVNDERAGTDDAERYAKGQRKSLPLSSCRHFVRRGVAEWVDGRPED